MQKDYLVTDEAVVGARRSGIVRGNIRARVSNMVKKSAPVSHPAGNRRYKRFVFRVTNNVVVGVALFQETADA